ncbi:MAG: hypothetical protein JXQ90_15750 [Cyclobacteriaceae bacterium]
MKGLSFSSLRVGERYWAVNFRERFEFELIEIVNPGEFVLKDVHTLELLKMSDILRFGKGKDFEIRELS